MTSEITHTVKNEDRARANRDNGTLAIPNRLLHTFDAASTMLSVSQGMLRKLARLGRIKVTRIGRSTRLSQEEILRLCSGGQMFGGGK